MWNVSTHPDTWGIIKKECSSDRPVEKMCPELDASRSGFLIETNEKLVGGKRQTKRYLKV